ncbi:hypothetical protein ACHAXT_003512 [Thalassiosira profunda]
MNGRCREIPAKTTATEMGTAAAATEMAMETVEAAKAEGEMEMVRGNGNSGGGGGGGNTGPDTEDGTEDSGSQGGGGNPNQGGGNPNKPDKQQGGQGGGGGGGGNPNSGGDVCPAETETCDEGGVQMCRLRNARKEIVANFCVRQAKQQSMLLARGGACGCCDFANPVTDGKANTGACPTGTCDAGDDCEKENDDGTTTPGSYMCRKKGQGGRTQTMCVAKEQVLRMQGRGATCGCCDGGCPSGPCSVEGPAVSCSLDDGETSEDGGGRFLQDATTGYYMCRSIGNPKRGRYKTQCVADEETFNRQLKGDQCGCCDGEGGASASCPAVCVGNTCVKEVDDGETTEETSTDSGATRSLQETPTTETGSLMCMRNGRTMCVVGEETIIQRQLNGQATCGPC